MIPEIRNLFTEPLTGGSGEVFQQLLEGGAFRLESIASRGTASPEESWYDQAHPEWVLLVRGTASLEFNGNAPVDLSPGDYLLIPARCRHRVASVSPDALWLALHALQL